VTFRLARVTVEYNYGWECATCEAAMEAECEKKGSSAIQHFDSGYSIASDAGSAARWHNQKVHHTKPKPKKRARPEGAPP
jgi:hypothetical protein